MEFKQSSSQHYTYTYNHILTQEQIFYSFFYTANYTLLYTNSFVYL